MAKAEKSAMVNTELQHFAQALFGIDGLVNTALYVPQMVKTWKVPQGTSLSTWGFWAITSADGVFYATVVAQNLELALVLGGNLVGCSIIFALAITRKTRGVRNFASPSRGATQESGIS
ncbi:hypothetical protein [Acidithiobacillus ferrivorans]|nr:hypothetical protein [Acidithiobacillus ferrivorans]